MESVLERPTCGKPVKCKNAVSVRHPCSRRPGHPGNCRAKVYDGVGEVKWE